MLLRDIMRVPYVISPDVLSDRRATSVRLVIPRDQIPERVVSYLRKSGFAVDLQGGTVYVSKSGHRFAASSSASPAGPSSGGSVPFGSPLAAPSAPVAAENTAQDPAPSFSTARPEIYTPPPPEPETAILAYIPAHRDPAYLASVVGAMFPALKFGARGAVKGQQAEANILPVDGPDVLVMSGTADELEKARKLVRVLDRARPMVAVKAVVMQVSNIQSRGSALSVLASIGKANGKFSIGSFGADAPAAQLVRIASGAFSAVLSAVREDSRVKVVASPNLSALSGAVATMNAGAQVPTVGSVAVTDGGTPVQSVVYRDSGITLTVRPVVRGDLIELAVDEERSTFVRTATGVEDSPTLQKSSASAQVVMRSGESVVLAGLSEASDGHTREGLFGGLLGVRSRDKSDSELMVLLTAELVPSPDAPPGIFLPIGADDQQEGNDDDGNAVDALAPLPGRA